MQNLSTNSAAVEPRKPASKKLLGVGILLLCAILVTGYIFLVRPALLKLRYKLEYAPLILAEAEKNDLDPALVAAVIFCESGYRPTVSSGAGARGLMQLMPATAAEVAQWLDMKTYTEDQLNQPEVNIALGCRYLRYLIEEFQSEKAAIAAYNAGPGRTKSWLKEYGADSEGCPVYIPYPETDKYVRKVTSARRMYAKLYPELVLPAS